MSGLLFPSGGLLLLEDRCPFGLFDEPSELGSGHVGCRVQGEVGNRIVFQGAEAEPACEDFYWDLGECFANPDLDGADCAFADQVSATESDVRLVALEPCVPVTAATVCVPRPVACIDNPFQPPLLVTPLWNNCL